MKIPPIETPRLLLRGFTKEDALWAFRIWNDPEVGKYLPDEPMLEPDPEYIRELEKLGDDEECCYLIPTMKERPEQRVGTCSFLPLDEGKTYDLAYCVHPDFWKQGYATEMAQGMIEYARRQGGGKSHHLGQCRKCRLLPGGGKMRRHPDCREDLPKAEYRSGDERNPV